LIAPPCGTPAAVVTSLGFERRNAPDVRSAHQDLRRVAPLEAMVGEGVVTRAEGGAINAAGRAG